jgi:hypothetical protein
MPDTPTAPALKVGDRIRDNDPRHPNRSGVVTAITNGKAMTGLGRAISLSRIHLDGKPRRSGWSVVR